MFLHLPLSFANVRWPIALQVSAVDATPSCQGTFFAPVPGPLTEGLYRICEHKGCNVRLDWSDLYKSITKLPLIDPKQDVNELFMALPWEVCTNRDFPQTHHVNIQELSALACELERLALGRSRRFKNTRYVCGSDSQVAIGAWSKGRSSSRQLNAVLRRSLGISLLSRIKLVTLYLNTEYNPADAPSRNKPLDSQRPIPAWCEHLFPASASSASFACAPQDDCRTAEVPPVEPQAGKPCYIGHTSTTVHTHAHSAPKYVTLHTKDRPAHSRQTPACTQESKWTVDPSPSETPMCDSAYYAVSSLSNSVGKIRKAPQAPSFLEFWAGKAHLTRQAKLAGWNTLPAVDAFLPSTILHKTSPRAPFKSTF